MFTNSPPFYSMDIGNGMPSTIARPARSYFKKLASFQRKRAKEEENQARRERKNNIQNFLGPSPSAFAQRIAGMQRTKHLNEVQKPVVKKIMICRLTPSAAVALAAKVECIGEACCLNRMG